MSKLTIGAILLSLLALAGCATPQSYDYSAFRESKPRSILVLPPQNHTTDIKATNGLYAQVTMPLAESGYYVYPVAVVNETFRQNGVQQPAEIQVLPAKKLQQIFGADAALYIDIKQYGTTYLVVSSDTRVTASAKLVDLRTGKLLWEGQATASSQEQEGSGGGGLVGMLVQAVVSQIANSIADKSYDIAGITSNRLLWAGTPNGILYGPRSPNYAKQK